MRVGLQRLVKTFAKWDITAISCLRSLMALSQLVPTLKSLGIEDEATIQKLQAAIISTETFDVEAAKAAAAAAEEAESSSSEEEEEEEEKQPKSKHKVHLSKKEYDEILQWSDDEDMTTVHGRFRHEEALHEMSISLGREGLVSTADVREAPEAMAAATLGDVGACFRADQHPDVAKGKRLLKALAPSPLAKSSLQGAFPPRASAVPTARPVAHAASAARFRRG